MDYLLLPTAIPSFMPPNGFVGVFFNPETNALAIRKSDGSIAGLDAVTQAEVIAALGFTPGTVTQAEVIAALGFTPGTAAAKNTGIGTGQVPVTGDYNPTPTTSSGAPTNAARATGTLTITSNVPHENSTVQIGATTYTWKATPTTALHLQIGATDDAAGVATSVASLAAKVNATSTDVTAAVTATGVVTFTAVAWDDTGNALALVLGGTTTHQAVSHAHLLGGTAGTAATVLGQKILIGTVPGEYDNYRCEQVTPVIWVREAAVLKSRMVVTGVFHGSNNTDPFKFPVLLCAGLLNGKKCFTHTGLPLTGSGIEYGSHWLWYEDHYEFFLQRTLNGVPTVGWQTAEDVLTPDLVGTWYGIGDTHGVPVVREFNSANDLIISGYTEVPSEIYPTPVVAACTLDISASTSLRGLLTHSQACTFTMPTAVLGKSFTLFLKQAATTGGGTAIFTGVIWSEGTTPVQTTTAGTMDIYSFVAGPDAAGTGVRWYGSVIQNFTPV